jgi:hypothetical protein
MSSLKDRLRPNAEEVAAKVLDGEAIMINLSDGTYYSMDGVGGFIWEMLEGGHSLGEMVRAIAARYDVSQAQAQADVERLAAQLIEENLVKLSGDGAPPREGLQPESDQSLPYESPQLNIYRDMADLLALDPPMPGFGEPVWKEPDE